MGSSIYSGWSPLLFFIQPFYLAKTFRKANLSPRFLNNRKPICQTILLKFSFQQQVDYIVSVIMYWLRIIAARIHLFVWGITGGKSESILYQPQFKRVEINDRYVRKGLYKLPLCTKMCTKKARLILYQSLAILLAIS